MDMESLPGAAGRHISPFPPAHAALRGVHVAPVYRRPLKLVAGRRVPVIQMGIGERIDLLHPSPVQIDSKAAIQCSPDLSKISIHHIEFPVVPGEEDPAPLGKFSFPLIRRHPDSFRRRRPSYANRTASCADPKTLQRLRDPGPPQKISPN